MTQGPAPHAPLDPPTIRSLQDRIRGLLPPQLAAFSRAFRSAFQVPDWRKLWSTNLLERVNEEI